VDIEPIKIEGLDEFRRNLKRIDSALPKGIRLAGNEAAGIVVDWARPRIPLGKTGRTRRSLRATSTQSASKVTGGGARVPWYGWLDFGGRVGRKRSVVRPFLPNGRYIYRGYQLHKDDIRQAYEDALVRLVEESGVSVDE
jgi:hypothetical protein